MKKLLLVLVLSVTFSGCSFIRNIAASDDDTFTFVSNNGGEHSYSFTYSETFNGNIFDEDSELNVQDIRKCDTDDNNILVDKSTKYSPGINYAMQKINEGVLEGNYFDKIGNFKVFWKSIDNTLKNVIIQVTME